MRSVAIALVVAGGAIPAPALGAGDANAAKGLLAGHCSRCHEGPGYGSGGGFEGADPPPLVMFANDPQTYTTERLRACLRQPHLPMKEFTLSARDIENPIAFIHSLRERQGELRGHHNS